MSPEATVVLAAVLCAVGGALGPTLVARVPEPAPSPEPEPAGLPKVRYAEVAARPRLAVWTTLVSGLAGALVGHAVGWDAALVGLLPLVPVCVALAVVDLHTRLLPRVVVLPATGVLLVLAVLGAAVSGDPDPLVRAVVGMVAARSFFWVLWFVHSAGMGFGDVRLAALLGLALGHLGWAELVVGTYAGFLLFAVPGLLLAIARRDLGLLRASYPFGPAMIAGALLGVVAGPAVLDGLVGR
ncbi:prepilin peptidase [Nocardioides dongkuii]|uniref:prepilin peptidase n=1 Tax=Nocardioides dongkuii TaxID=2760089 RepID=UPI0015FC27DC|nr:A24 family peptidase [Nocardioides dongkuii]